jgi:hypothetical protein
VPKANRIPPAFKHGAYAATTVLPGEDPKAFERLHRDLIAELTPNGALEDDIVATIARLVWRKQNLATLRIVEVVKAEIEKAEDLARRELGYTTEYVEIDVAATLESFTKELAIEEQLNAMLDKCLKQLLFVRGLKSISSTSSSVPPARIAGPAKER